MADLSYHCPPPPLLGLEFILARQNEVKGSVWSIFRNTCSTVIGVFKKLKVSCHRPSVSVLLTDSSVQPAGKTPACVASLAEWGMSARLRMHDCDGHIC